MPNTVLILGSAEDAHARHMKTTLEAAGHRALYFDASLVPAENAISIDPSTYKGHLVLGDQTIRTDEISSVYWRQYGKADALVERVTQNDTRSLVQSFLMAPNLNWVNGWEGFHLHQHKPFCLYKVAQAGYRIPQTFITSEYKELSTRVSEWKEVIVKPVQGGIMSQKVGAKELKLFDASARLPPMTVQEYIPGTNVRVFVAGDRVAGCEIRTTEIDFRDDVQPDLKALTLPDEIVRQSKEIATLLALKWSGIDYRVNEKGDYYFLEANPSPMFMGFEKYTGLPLTDMLMDLLIIN